MMTSEKEYKCVCQSEAITQNELRAHLLNPQHHIVIRVKNKKPLNHIIQIKQRIKFIKSTTNQLAQTNQKNTQNIQNCALIKLKQLSLNLLIKYQNSKHSQIYKNIKLFYNTHTIKLINNFKYLKHQIHQGFNLFQKSRLSTIRSMSIEENLKIMVCGGNDGTLRFFNLESLSQITALSCHESDICAIDTKSKYCISGSYDSKICFFNLKTKKLKKCFQTFHGTIFSLKISEASKSFVSGSEKGYIGIWSLKKKMLLFQLFANSCVMFLRLIKNDCFLVCSTFEGFIQKFKLPQKYPLIKKQYKKELWCSSLIEETDILLTGHADGFIQVLKQFQLFKTFKAHSQNINSIDYCLKTAKFVSGSSDQTVKVWSLSSFSLLTVHHFKQQVFCVKLLNNQLYSSGHEIKYFDLSSQTVIKTTTMKKFNCFILSVSIKLKMIVYGFERVYLFCVISNSDICCRSFESELSYLVFSSCFILCGTSKGFIYCVDTPFLEIKKKYFFGVCPILFVRATKNWEVISYSNENKSFVQDLRNSKILLTHNQRIKVGKFREKIFVFVDLVNEVYVSINFRSIRKISEVYSFQLFWCRSEDYILLKKYDSGFIIMNIKRKENERKLESLKGVKYFMNKKREYCLSFESAILSSLNFRRGYLN